MDERTLNDLLECSVCLERLDTTSKVLPCQHTFCRKCLEVIVASHSELRCPECRILVDIKIDDLPPNVLLMRILGGMKNTATVSAETISPLQMHKQQMGVASTAAGNLTISNLNSINSEHGIGGVNAYIRDQVKRAANAAAQNSGTGGHRSTGCTTTTTTTAAAAAAAGSGAATVTSTTTTNAIITMVKPNTNPATIDDNTQNGLRSIQQPSTLPAARQPLQTLPSTVNSNNSQSQQQCNNATSPASIPHAKALYDFESKEPGDLNFKKGDRIVLRRRIDVNWFVGECNGREGVFPLNYVQIIVPLAQPQCKALYDFRMGPNEEEGCLTFKKGAIINVLRRVDHNWAEGRIDDTIGIFPISFCEMNPLAKLLMDASSKYMHYAMQQRNVPPTPSDQQSQQQIQQNHHHQQQQQHNSFSSGSSSLTTSPVSPNSSSTTTSTSSNSAPMNPIKNNSNQLTTQNVAIMTNASAAGNKRDALHANTQTGNSTNNANHSSNNRHVSKEMPTNDKPRAQSSQKQSKAYNNSMSGNRSSSNSKSNQRQRQNSQSCTSVPSNAYVALFPYKPQKSDELELKKGSIYYVKERCQDGWFRGVNRAQKTGVFPGNYVTQLRTLNEQSNGQSASGATGAGVGIVGHSKRSAHGSHSGGGATNITVLNKSGNQNPPDLPPRSSGSSSSSSSSSTSVWSKPIGQHVEALFGRSQSSSTVNLIKRITNIKRSKSPVQQSTPAYSMDNPVFEDNTIGGTDTTNTQQQTNSSVGTGVNATASAAAAAKRNTIHLSHPQHVRSGSCPSQLLQSLPVDINLSLSAGTSGALNKAEMFGSHRIRPHKERAALQQMTNHSFGAAGQMKAADNNSSSPYHRKSQSLDAATIAAQLTNCASDAANVNKRKSYTHNEKFKCIVSYPPNSDFELELSVGDIVYVHKKRDNGWYKGTHAQTGKVGLFPSSFVEPVI